MLARSAMSRTLFLSCFQFLLRLLVLDVLDWIILLTFRLIRKNTIGINYNYEPSTPPILFNSNYLFALCNCFKCTKLVCLHFALLCASVRVCVYVRVHLNWTKTKLRISWFWTNLQKDLTEPLPGYLSLHQTPNMLTIKWTPNQLMNGYTENDANDTTTTTSYWDYSMNINVEDIVYVHCHQASGQDTGGTIILVGHDGVQRSPIIFPEGGHMAAFLGCLETGLLPHGQLDPPIWSHKGIGKIFPWASKNKRKPLPLVMESEEDVPIDYVFRIVNKSNNEEFREFLSKFQVNHLRSKLQSVTSASILDLGRTSPRRSHLSSSSTNESSDSSNKSLDTYGPESPLIVSRFIYSLSINLVLGIQFSFRHFAADHTQSNGKHCFGLYNNAKTDYITSILWMVGLLPSFIHRSNTFIGTCQWENYTRQ